MWKSSEEGINHVKKLKGAVETTFSDFQKFAEIFMLPVYVYASFCTRARKRWTYFVRI
jgi:hypothetical protein